MARWFRDRSPQQGIPSISLRRLLPEARFVGCQDLLVSGCSADSRRLDPGQVFVAISGDRHDGHSYVSRALDRGAAGVLVERPCPEAGPIQVVVPDTRAAHAKLCRALAGEAASKLPLIAIAGRKGRSATATFLRAIFEAAGTRVGTVGASGWFDGKNEHPPGADEPGAQEFAEIVAAMAERGCARGLVEVSEKVLDRRLFSGLSLSAAVVTDLPDFDPETEPAERERLGFARLMRSVAPGGWTIVPADDSAGELLGAVNLDARRLAFGSAPDADLGAEVLSWTDGRARIGLRGLGVDAELTVGLPGQRYARAALAAATVARALGVAPAAIVAGIEAVRRVPGEFEIVDEGQPYPVWIRSASSADEAEETLEEIRARTDGKLHLVVHLPSDPASVARWMAAVANRTDRLILSAATVAPDDANTLLDDALTQARKPGRIRVATDRRRAIEEAIGLAVEGDGVLIVGDGRRRAGQDGSIVRDCLRRTPATRTRRSA